MGRAGRNAILENAHALRKTYKADVCVANGENMAGGFGLSREHTETLLRAGIDVFTTGNHVWSKREIIGLMDEMPILRPLNFPKTDPGRGHLLYTADNGETLCVINLIGISYMGMVADNPFAALDDCLKTVETPHILVDFHAEATGEKRALGYYADGRVSAVFGTHTHVQTADAGILPHGTAYISDAGMCGAADSVLGATIPCAISRFTSSVRKPYESAEGRHMVSAVFVETDKNGKATCIERIAK